MDGTEYLKYVTEKVVGYLDRPTDEDGERQKPPKRSKEHWATRWFGVAPLGVMVWWGARAERKKTRPEARSSSSASDTRA